MPFSITRLLASVLACALSAAPALAVPCGGNFEAWLESFRREAAAKGISQRTISAALTGVSHNPQVIERLQRKSDRARIASHG
jgi:membrane-bound lytic murein transglycosylase B